MSSPLAKFAGKKVTVVIDAAEGSLLPKNPTGTAASLIAAIDSEPSLRVVLDEPVPIPYKGASILLRELVLRQRFVYWDALRRMLFVEVWSRRSLSERLAFDPRSEILLAVGDLKVR